MKISPISLKDLAEFLSIEFVGDEDQVVTGINEIHQVEKGDLVFVDHPKYYQKSLESAATTILINSKDVDVPQGKSILISEDPFADYNKLVKFYAPFEVWHSHQSYRLGSGSVIQPGVHIGKQVEIGKNCIIHSGVVINDRTVIGDNVIIHPNTVLGTDAFYCQKKNGNYRKLHSCGRVVIKDDVEIGATSTIDRGVSGDTIIGKGTRIDNQVHVGHDTRIGQHCLIAAQVGIAGCVVLEDNVTLWGQVGIPANIVVGEGAVLLGQSAPIHSLEGGKTYFGSPAVEARSKYRELALVRKLPEIIENLKGL